MLLIMHYPQDAEAVSTLRRKAAEIQADAVTSYLQKLNCSTEQKRNLLSQIIKYAEKSSANG